MNEYISREELIKALEADYNREWDSKPQGGPEYVEGARDEYDDVLRIVCSIALADVQPVVHCKDCKHRKELHYEESDEKPYIKYECKFTKYSMSDNGFCSFGARMDNNTRGRVNELDMEVGRPDGNCLDCKFQYLDNSDYWCSICPGNPEDI